MWGVRVLGRARDLAKGLVQRSVLLRAADHLEQFVAEQVARDEEGDRRRGRGAEKHEGGAAHDSEDGAGGERENEGGGDRDDLQEDHREAE